MGGGILQNGVLGTTAARPCGLSSLKVEMMDAYASGVGSKDECHVQEVLADLGSRATHLLVAELSVCRRWARRPHFRRRYVRKERSRHQKWSFPLKTSVGPARGLFCHGQRRGVSEKVFERDVDTDP